MDFDNYFTGTTLHLVDVKLSNDELASFHHWANGKTLTTIIIQNSGLDDSDIAKLFSNIVEHLKDLVILDLRRNQIGETGAIKIVAALHLCNLEQLWLTQNRIGGAGAIAIAEAKHLSNLKVLSLNRNQISEAGAIAIAKAKHLCNLEYLDLGTNNIGETGANAIAKARHLSNLQILALDCSRIGEAGAIAIIEAHNLSNLKMLSLRENYIGGEASAKAIAKARHLENLEALYLGENFIGETGAIAIAKARHLENLNTLELYGCRISEAGAIALIEAKHLSNLSSLNLMDNQIREFGAKAISKAHHLENLEELYLGLNSIDEAGAIAIAKARHLENLNTLNLDSCRIGEAGAIALIEAKHLSNLSSLNLEGNQIRELGAKAIARAHHLENLEELHLGSNPIGEAGAIAIAKARHLENLNTLSLGSCRIGEAGAIALIEAKHLSNLSLLNLAENQIGELGAAAIVEAEHLSTLRVLWLYSNDIGDTGARAIVESTNLSQLTSLSLVRNNLQAPEHIQDDIEALREYYRQKYILDEVPLFNVRTLLIGHPGVGKSTLFRALNEQQIMLGDLNRTHGVDRLQLTLPSRTHHNFGKFTPTLDVWDMGGQRLQHMVHSLFFRGKALYLLVVNFLSQAHEVDHWLKQICVHHHKESPVWLMPVRNPKDGDTGELTNRIPERLWTDYATQCKLLEPTLLKVDKEHDHADAQPIFDALLSALPNFPFQTYLAPYATIANELGETPRSFYRQSDFRTFLHQHARVREIFESVVAQMNAAGETISDDLFYDNLVYYLDHLGRVSYLGNPEGEGWVIASPQYVQKGLYALLPPEDKTADDNSAVQIFRKKLHTVDADIGFMGVFTKTDLLPVIKSLFADMLDDTQPLGHLVDDVLSILSHRSLGMVLTLNKEANVYFVPAYVEESAPLSKVSQLQHIVSNYQKAVFTYVIKKSSPWPVYFLYRYIVWRSQADNNLNLIPDIVSFESGRITFREPAPYGNDEDRISIEIIELDDAFWCFGYVGSDSREMAISDVIHSLYNDMQDCLNKHNDPNPRDITRLIPCTGCMQFLVKTVTGHRNHDDAYKASSTILDNIGFFTHKDIVTANDRTEFKCSRPYQPHSLYKESILSPVNSVQLIPDIKIDHLIAGLALANVCTALIKAENFNQTGDNGFAARENARKKDMLDKATFSKFIDYAKTGKIKDNVQESTVKRLLWVVLKKSQLVWKWAGIDVPLKRPHGSGDIEDIHFCIIVKAADNIPEEYRKNT